MKENDIPRKYEECEKTECPEYMAEGCDLNSDAIVSCGLGRDLI